MGDWYMYTTLQDLAQRCKEKVEMCLSTNIHVLIIMAGSNAKCLCLQMKF